MGPIRDAYQKLRNQWDSSIVSRDQIERFTGGAITAKRMANLDSLGEGPDGRMRVGRKVVYRVDKFIEWLESRTQELV